MRTTLRLLMLPLGAVLLLGGIEFFGSENGGAPVAAASLPKPGFGPANFAEAQRDVAAQLSLARERAARRPDDWLVQASLARALMAQSSLTGGYAMLEEAQRVAALANDLAPEQSGHMLVAAYTAMGAHRLDAVKEALDRFALKVVPAAADEQAEVLGLRGDLAFYQGDLQAATRLYAEARILNPSPGTVYRQALLAKARGEFERAEGLFREALAADASPTPRTVADIAVQLGALDQAQGDYSAARAHFIEADRLFPGFWLYESHVAQVDYLTGRESEALVRLEAMLAQGEQPVEVTELYALLLQSEGRDAESRRWSARATAIWDERLEAMPEAAYGHAIEHHFKFGSADRALELARRNLAERPYGEARLLLAEALLATGDPAGALAQMRRARRDGWLSAPHLRAEVNALEALGRRDEARAVRSDAEAINPHVFDPVSEFVWFSHG
ncbi:MAG: hypothetical protein JY451_03045 [Erythrobacter sp.]|nr:MAG: hypothetical protein JY451_03045 [Erythrobacter sp.]